MRHRSSMVIPVRRAGHFQQGRDTGATLVDGPRSAYHSNQLDPEAPGAPFSYGEIRLAQLRLARAALRVYGIKAEDTMPGDIAGLKLELTEALLACGLMVNTRSGPID